MGNMCEILMYIYVSLNDKLSRRLHDGTIITRLLLRRQSDQLGVKKQKADLETPWWVPVCPLGRRFVDEVDVLALWVPS